MTDKISLPLSNMSEVGKQFINESDTLMRETESRYQQILNTKGRLPASMQSAFDGFLDPFMRDLHQMLTLRLEMGEALIDAVGVSQDSDASASTGFPSQ